MHRDTNCKNNNASISVICLKCLDKVRDMMVNFAWVLNVANFADVIDCGS